MLRNVAPRLAVLAGGAVGLLVLLGGLLWFTVEVTAAEERLLPGTTVAGIDAGDRSAAEVERDLERTVDAMLDRAVVLEHGDERWEVIPRELGVTADADATVAEALEETSALPVWEVGLARWLGAEVDVEVDVSLDVPRRPLDGVTAEVADEIDRPARDATLERTGEDIELVEEQVGLTVDTDALHEQLESALAEGRGETIEVPVDERAPAVRTATVEGALPTIGSAVERELERTIELSAGDHEREVTVEELDPVPDLEGALASVLEGEQIQDDLNDDGHADLRVALDVESERIDGLVADIAAEVDRPVRNASIDWSSGWIELTGERPGRALDTDAASAELEVALHERVEAVDLPVETIDPEVTREAYDQVLLLRQDLRRLYLYEDGEIVREWPVAVGMLGSPTPTGTFTVGQKRYMPTWVNPAPDGWGTDMPEVVGPGPDNPLGIRALNWNRNGTDTLIRFHGTPDTGSIGQAASRGCVRMTNADVAELYDLVPSGTKIVSLSG